jgi:hypothetical protein
MPAQDLDVFKLPPVGVSARMVSPSLDCPIRQSHLGTPGSYQLPEAGISAARTGAIVDASEGGCGSVATLLRRVRDRLPGPDIEESGRYGGQRSATWQPDSLDQAVQGGQQMGWPRSAFVAVQRSWRQHPLGKEQSNPTAGSKSGDAWADAWQHAHGLDSGGVSVGQPK